MTEVIGNSTSIFVTSPPPAYGTPFAYINTAAESNTPATTIRMNQSSNASMVFLMEDMQFLITIILQ